MHFRFGQNSTLKIFTILTEMSKSPIRHFANIYCTPILWCLCVHAVRLIDTQQNVTSWLLQELNENKKIKMQWGHVDEIATLLYQSQNQQSK